MTEPAVHLSLEAYFNARQWHSESEKKTKRLGSPWRLYLAPPAPPVLLLQGVHPHLTHKEQKKVMSRQLQTKHVQILLLNRGSATRGSLAPPRGASLECLKMDFCFHIVSVEGHGLLTFLTFSSAASIFLFLNISIMNAHYVFVAFLVILII